MGKTYQSIEQPTANEVTPLTKNDVDEEALEEEISSTSAFSTWSRGLPGGLSSSKSMIFAGACIGMVLFLGVLPESVTRHVRLFRSRDLEANVIKICVNQMIKVTPEPAPKALVTCYDKDPLNHDDFMCQGVTGNDGCLTMKYTYQPWDGFGGWNPDIYCQAEKKGFVKASPPDKDHWDQTKTADFGTVMMYRDRKPDYGHTNGCGPWWTEIFGINYFASWATRFGTYCFHHDKCYWDCQIFLALGKDPKKSQEFCDYEMFEGMKGWCYRNSGDIDGGGVACIGRAKAIYNALKLVGGTAAYDKSEENCPRVNGKLAPSMGNDYSHPGARE